MAAGAGNGPSTFPAVAGLYGPGEPVSNEGRLSEP